jgi:hypothetical protein
MRKINLLSKLLTICLLLMGAGMLTSNAQYSKYPSGDATIYEADPDATVSAASNIFVGSVTGDDEIIALVKFDISGLAGRQIESAEFSTRSDMNDGTTMTVKLTGAGTSFARDTTTWNNKPSISGTELATVILDQESGRKIYVETGTALTDYINSKLMAGDTEVAFAIQYKEGDGGDLKWMGGKGDAAWGPLLEMTFSNSRTYSPSADGTIYQAYPDSAVAHNSNIFVGLPAENEEVVALVQFDLSGLAYRQIGEAAFSTRSDMNDGTTMTVKLTPAGDNFDRSVTWNTKPTLGGTELATVVLDQESTRKTYVETGSALVDYINGILAKGGETVSLAIRYKDGAGGDFKWMGGKGDGAWGPMLSMEDITDLPAAYENTPTDDATIYQAYPDSSVAHASNIFIGLPTADEEVVALVKFDVSAFANRKVTTVNFSTRSDMNDGTTMTVKLTGAGTGFSRDTTNWNNKPSISGSELASVVLDQESTRKYYTENGTALVDYVNSKLMAGDDEIAFAIRYKEGDGGDFKWMGGKGDGAWGPMLEFEFGTESAFYGIKDGTIYEALPDQAVADVHNSNVFIGSTTGDDEIIALVQFELTGLAYTEIEGVSFSTRSDMNDGTTMTVKLTPAGDDFDRTTTWNTKPSTPGDELASVVMDQESNRKYYTENGTAFIDYINGILAAGKETVSLALQYKEGDGGDLKWCGGVGDGSFGPMLEIASPSLAPESDFFTVVEDVFVDEADPDANKDRNSDMGIRKADDGTSNEVYLKFNISEAANAVAGDVRLRLYIAQHNSGTQRDNFYAEVFAIETNEWDETTLTWNTKPAAGKKLLEGNVTWYNAGKDTVFMGADLTHYFNEAVAAGKEFITLAIKGKDNTPGDRLWMAESNWKPEATQLLVDYTVEPPEKKMKVVADSYVDQSNPDNNYGTEADQHLINDDSNNLSKWVYQKYDISTAYEDVISATLRVYARIHDSAPDITTFPFQVFGVNDIAWEELGINWSNKPSATGNAFFEATADKTGGYVNLSSGAFTDFINAAIEAGKDSVTVVIKGKIETPGNRAWISGRTYKAPELILNYEKQAVQPRFVTTPGEYISSVDVQISTLTSGATIYYTLDGSEPTDASTQYTEPITLSESATIKAIAYAPDLKESPVAIGSFTITPVGLPQFSLSAVPKYQPPIEVAITVEPEDAVIRYSDDGGNPTTLYTEPLVLSQTTTLKAQAFSADFTYSTEVVEVTYTIIPPTGTAGTGPGGVGFKDLSRSGQPELGLWLKPEMLNVADGEAILEWPDASGNENDAYNTWEDGGANAIPETAESQNKPPVMSENALNGKPIAILGAAEGERGTLIVDDADNLDGGEGQSIFIVMKRNEIFPDFAAIFQKRDVRGGDPAIQAYVLEMNGGADPNTMQFVIARDIFLRTDQIFNADDYYILNPGLNGDAGLSYFNVNGLQEKTAAYGKPINSVAATLIIGGFQAMSLAEVAYFNSTMNAAQTKIIHEYLASKYGLTLEGGNLYTNAEYVSDLIGIGKASDLSGTTDEEHLHATGGALELKADAFAAAGDFVFAAHNGEAVTEDDNKVWSRMWYVEAAGNGGNVSLVFDFAKAGLTLDAAEGYILSYKATADGEWTDMGLTAAKDGDKLEFAVTDIQSGWYAIGKGLPGTSSVEDLKDKAAFKVYPNPATEMITVSLNNTDNGPVNINIYDLSGRIAASSVEFKASLNFETTLDISMLDRGMYMIEVNQGGEKSIQPLVVR